MDAEPTDLRGYLAWLHVRAGAPSSRSLAARVHLSHTTVNDVLRGRRFTWRPVERVVVALGGDVDHVRRLWLDLGNDERPHRSAAAQRFDALGRRLDEVVAELRALRERLGGVNIEPRDSTSGC